MRGRGRHLSVASRRPVARPRGKASGRETTAGKERAVADLIAIGYDDETSAAEAELEVERVAQQLSIEPDALAVIVRDGDGRYRVRTNHHMVGSDATWGMLWGPLFGVLFFVPVLGMAVGAGLDALMGRIARLGIDKEFQDRARDVLQPGSSALFMVVDKVTPDTAMEAVSRYGGTVLTSSLSKHAERELQDDLHGASVAA